MIQSEKILRARIDAHLEQGYKIDLDVQDFGDGTYRAFLKKKRKVFQFAINNGGSIVAVTEVK